jgi:S1-C subfamily serine protease
VVEQLIATGKVKRAVLGVTVREVQRGDPARDPSAALGNQPALRVEEVRPDSAAARAELHCDDLILAVDGEPVGDPAGFAAAIANRSGKTPLRVLRAGKRLDLTVELHAQ